MKFFSIILLILSFAFSSDMQAQDMVFSYNAASTMHGNPAFTGLFDGRFRTGTSYRNQYFNAVPQSQFSLKSIFFDTRFNVIKNDFLSVGAVVTDEQIGTAKIGKANILVNLSFSKMLSFDKYRNRSHYLVIGTQMGVGKNYTGDGDFLFGIQFDKSKQILDSNISSGELKLDYGIYPDINIGLLYYFSSRYGSFYSGLSALHINMPDASYLEREVNNLKIRYSFVSGGHFKLKNDLDILPSLSLNLQSYFINLITGSQIGFNYNSVDSRSMQFGFFMRTINSTDEFLVSDFIFSTSFVFRDFSLGLSYDVNVSSLRRFTGMNGAFEIHGIYWWGVKPVRNILKCPKL